jgi:hypothetical protein
VKQATIVIADLRIGLHSNQDMTESLLDHSFFDEGDGDIRLTVHYETAPAFKIKRRLFDSGDTWALFESEGKYVVQNDALESGSAPDTFVVLEPDFNFGEIFTCGAYSKEKLPPDPLPYPLNQILMILLLSRGRGLLFHACGIDDDGKGYLFLGNSGDGKSTSAKLWFDHGITVLNDDRIIVREKEGKFWMYGTPWHGDFKEHSSHGLPIDKLFFLRHGKKNSAQAKGGVEAVSMLLARSFPPFWDKDGMSFTIEFCQRLVNQIPCYELTFVPDAGIIDFVRSIQTSPSHRRER